MPTLSLYNKTIDSVFELLGINEDDITYSLAWGLYSSPSFLREFLKNVISWTGDIESISISLQQSESGGGRTDIEILQYKEFHIIIEAKRGWNLPSMEQLGTYTNRKSFHKSLPKIKKLVVLSECSKEYFNTQFEVDKINGVPLDSISYKHLMKMAENAIIAGNYSEKRILGQLKTYLGKIMSLQNITSNLVYVVSLSLDKPKGWGISWIDIIEKKNKYFHPVGGKGRGGWPKKPPNYIGFRYHGKLQSIHHIEDFEVGTNLHDFFPEIPSEKQDDLYIYSLGEKIIPPKEIRSGRYMRNNRVWCMIDTLFICETVREAAALTKERRHES